MGYDNGGLVIINIDALTAYIQSLRMVIRLDCYNW